MGHEKVSSLRLQPETGKSTSELKTSASIKMRAMQQEHHHDLLLIIYLFTITN